MCYFRVLARFLCIIHLKLSAVHVILFIPIADNHVMGTEYNALTKTNNGVRYTIIISSSSPFVRLALIITSAACNLTVILNSVFRQ